MVDFPNWFNATAEANFVTHLRNNVDRTKALHALQLGSFTGDASVWLLNNVLTHDKSTLTDVDTWLGSDEPLHEGLNFARAEQLHDEAVAPYGDKVITFKGTTREFFLKFPKKSYDFIYVDASHKAVDVLEDVVKSHVALKVGGILALDDYIWGQDYPALDTPRPAIDVFLRFYALKYQVLGINNQVWLRKISD